MLFKSSNFLRCPWKQHRCSRPVCPFKMNSTSILLMFHFLPGLGWRPAPPLVLTVYIRRAERVGSLRRTRPAVYHLHSRNTRGLLGANAAWSVSQRSNAAFKNTSQEELNRTGSERARPLHDWTVNHFYIEESERVSRGRGAAETVKPGLMYGDRNVPPSNKTVWKARVVGRIKPEGRMSQRGRKDKEMDVMLDKSQHREETLTGLIPRWLLIS